MEAYQTETVIAEDGSLSLRSLPFRAGERVEVIVLSAPSVAAPRKAYPLRGTPYCHEQPTDPIAAADWEATR